MKLDYRGALKRLPKTVGVWLMHGNEALLEQNLLKNWRDYWQQAGIERQRFDLNSVNDWRDVFNALNSLSLFASQLAIEVHGNIKPDQYGLEQLITFLQSPADNMLLIVMPKQDSAAQKSKFYQIIEANGHVVNLSINSPIERVDILKHEAQQLGILLNDEAWQLLMTQNENNLFAAQQSLFRLSTLDQTGDVLTVEALQAALTEQSRFSSFDLANTSLEGQAVQAVKILQFLIESGEADSLILWALAREMRLLMQLLEQPNQYQKLGIWQNKIPAYQKAIKRLKPKLLMQWPALLQRTDEAIKGVNDENPKDLLLQITLMLCGKPLFH
jgi:DNA polymerase-3 subunit delta